jgi:hypothetical protein
VAIPDIERLLKSDRLTYCDRPRVLGALAVLGEPSANVIREIVDYLDLPTDDDRQGMRTSAAYNRVQAIRLLERLRKHVEAADTALKELGASNSGSSAAGAAKAQD